MIFALLLALLLQAGSVLTIDGRLEGRARLEEAGVAVDGELIPWGRVIYVLLDRPELPPLPDVVRLTTGEVLTGRVLSFSNGSLRIDLDPWGEREVKEELIAAIDFIPNPPSKLGSREPTLYLKGKEPLPGRLIEMSGSEIVVDSPFGEIRASREEAIRYVFGRKGKRRVSNGWEVGLTNGSRLFGELKLSGDGKALLDHPLLGELEMPVALIGYVARRAADLVDLTELIASAEEMSLLGFGRREGEVELSRHYEIDGKRYLKAMIIGAGSVVKFELPGEGERVLRALIAPMRGCRGDVRVEVRASGGTIFEAELKADSKALPLELNLSGPELVIEVGFGERLGFPCGIALIDPFLILR